MSWFITRISNVVHTVLHINTPVGAQITSRGLGRALTFADDILIFNTGSDRQTVKRCLGNTAGDMDTGSNVNPANACVMMCSFNINVMKADLLEMSCTRQIIKQKKKIKYIGIAFNRSLSFKCHVNHILQKANAY